MVKFRSTISPMVSLQVDSEQMVATTRAEPVRAHAFTPRPYAYKSVRQRQLVRDDVDDRANENATCIFYRSAVVYEVLVCTRKRRF